MHATKEFSSISELKHIREQKSRLSEREAELSVPVLDNISLIPQVYKWFVDISSQIKPDVSFDNVIQRKKFLYVTLFLFAPSVLAGGRMPNGIRSELSNVFPDITPCVISNNIREAGFEYKQYKDFRKDIDYIYIEILNRLKEIV